MMIMIAAGRSDGRDGPPTFLALVEDGRARMVVARLFRVGELLLAALVDALLGHGRRTGGKG